MPPEPDLDVRRDLATLVAFQLTRSPEQRERMMFPEAVREFLGDRDLTRELIAEFLSEHHLGFTPQSGEVEGAFSFASVALHDGSQLTPSFSVRVMVTTARISSIHSYR